MITVVCRLTSWLVLDVSMPSLSEVLVSIGRVPRTSSATLDFDDRWIEHLYSTLSNVATSSPVRDRNPPSSHDFETECQPWKVTSDRRDLLYLTTIPHSVVVGSVWVARNSVGRVEGCFRCSKQERRSIVHSLRRMLTINAVFKCRIFSVGSPLRWGNCRFDDAELILPFFLSKSSTDNRSLSLHWSAGLFCNQVMFVFADGIDVARSNPFFLSWLVLDAREKELWLSSSIHSQSGKKSKLLESISKRNKTERVTKTDDKRSHDSRMEEGSCRSLPAWLCKIVVHSFFLLELKLNFVMDKGPKKVTPPKADTGKIRSLVVTNSASNERKVRVNVQPSPKQTTEQSRPTTAPLPLLDCIQSTTFNSKAHDKSFPQRRRKPRANHRVSEADETDKANHSPRKVRPNESIARSPSSPSSQNDIGRSTIDIREPTVEHLAALRLAADVVLKERLISDQVLQQRLTVLTKFQQCITDARPGCQIQLYGSYLFKCAAERKTSFVDIDVQFKETLQYDTLKELLDIVTKSGLLDNGVFVEEDSPLDMCKEAVIDPEHKPACINLILNEANMGVRITSGYTRGFHLSNLIRIYTEIDPRVIQLLRLFRYFAKVCRHT